MLVAVVGTLLGLAPAADAANRSFTLRTAISGPIEMAQISNTWGNAVGALINTDSDPTTRASSKASLALPAGANVRWAGVYFGGRMRSDVPIADWAIVEIRPPGASAYTSVTGTTHDVQVPPDRVSAAFADVTGLIAAGGPGTYEVATKAAVARAGWGLVVIYDAPGARPRSAAIFDGFQYVQSRSVSATITGLTTPPTGTVKTSVGVLAYEADPGVAGDSVSLNGTPFGDACNPSTDLLNGSHCTFGANELNRDPTTANVRGHDGDLIRADGLLPNSATSAAVTLTAGADVVALHALSFITDLHAPILATTKSVSNVTNPGQPPAPADVLEYTVDVSNSGNDGAADLRVTDPLPGGTTFVPGSISGAGRFDTATNSVILNLGQGATNTAGGSLDASGGAVTSATATFRVKVGDDVRDGTLLRNTARFDFLTATFRVPLSQMATVDTTVRAADLTLVKTHAPSFVGGRASAFRIVATNIGGAATSGEVTVTDDLPAGISAFANASGVGWSCSIVSGTVRCTRSDALAAGGSYPPIVVDGSVADPAPATIVNVARVAGGNDSNTVNNSAADSEGTTSQAVLEISKSASPTTLLSGDDVTWTVTVANAGPSAAQDVRVDDPLPGADYDTVRVSTTKGTCTTVVQCDIGTLGRGQSAEIEITARVLANDIRLTNTATASSTTPNPDPRLTAVAHVDVLPTTDVSITKTASPATTMNVGQATSYTLTAGNAGPGAAEGVVVEDRVPDNIQPTSVTAPGWTCNATAAPGDTLTCSLDDPLAVGGAPSITLNGTSLDTADRLVDNTATITTTTGESDRSDNRSSTQQTILPAVDLTPRATVSPTTPVTAADDVTFSVEVDNLGPSTAVTPQLTYVLPTGVVFNAGASSGSCNEAGGTVTCTLPDLPSGATSAPLTIVVTPGGLIGSQSIANTFRAISPTVPDLEPDNDRTTAYFALNAAADVQVVKTADVATVAVGAPVTYTLAITNDGPDAADAVAVSDVLPAGVDFGAFTVNPAGCTHAAGVVSCSLGTLADQESVSVSFTAIPRRSAAGRLLTNTATVTTTTADIERGNDTGSADVSVDPLADIAVTSGIAPTSPRSTDLLGFTARVVNRGQNPVDTVTLTDTLPTGVEITRMPAGCSAAGQTITCIVGPLAVLEERLYTFWGDPGDNLAGTTLRHDSQVSSGPQPDDDLANNADFAQTALGELVDLAIDKRVSQSTAAVGDTLTFTLVLTNAGPNTATGVLVHDELPEGLTPTAATSTQGSCSITGRVVDCTAGSIDAGAGAQVLITARVDGPAAGGELINAATVTGTRQEARLADNTDHAGVTVSKPVSPPDDTGPRAAKVAVTKTADDTALPVGGTVRYTLTARNVGAVDATDVVVTDTPRKPLKVVSVKAEQGTCTKVVPVTCELGTVAAGQSVKIVITARPLTAGTLVNQATIVAGNGGGSDPDQAIAGASVDVRAAKLTISKRALRTTTRSGGVVPYLITVRSVGRTTAREVRVCDRLPRDTTLVSRGGGKLSGGSLCWRIATLAVGQRKTLRVQLRMDRSDKARVVRNVATASCTGGCTAAARAVAGANVRVRPAGSGRGGGVTG